MSEKLLPCPFCGGEPAVQPAGKVRRYAIYCTGEECFGPATTAGTEIDATVQWNTRHADAPETPSCVTVPREPTEEMWGGLARDLVMWDRGMPNQYGSTLYKHLRSSGRNIPEWLLREIPDIDHTPPKGTVAACIYKAMIAAAPIQRSAAIAAEPMAWPDGEDEAYEIGKRDGYESAIQDLDLATGGDGEFKGSTFPGETIDVPTMKARIIDRFNVEQSYADLRASGGIFPEAYAAPPTRSAASTVDAWQDISTAPIKPVEEVPGYYRFRCMLQDDRGYVQEGYAMYTHAKKQLTWMGANDRKVHPVYWMPLPIARNDRAPPQPDTDGDVK